MPENLRQGHRTVSGGVMKVGEQDRIAVGAAQILSLAAIVIGALDAAIGAQDIGAFIPFALTRCPCRLVVVALLIGHQQCEQRVDQG